MTCGKQHGSFLLCNIEEGWPFRHSGEAALFSSIMSHGVMGTVLVIIFRPNNLAV